MNIEAILEDLRKRPSEPDKTEAFRVLLHIMDDLRDKCPWDKKQTFLSLRNLTIEEMYELADALLENNHEDIKEEIGDIMLHMIFYAKIADEEGKFTITDALLSICRKLIHRHPHIYGDTTVKDEEEVKKNWEQLKLLEGKTSVLQGVPNGLPALVKSYRMQEKVAQVGFEWDHIDQVWEKVEEEIGELKEAIAEGNKEHIEHEFGDILFALVNYARFLKIDPETALEKVNKRFKSRFQYIENHATGALSDMTLEEMDVLWNEAKVVEKNQKK
ncbi:MAG: nucleoside triphosphate pyrophosphohydrolase [Saprospiraceae bacterium]|nr:nucleoside triphosphate pyrophosphohydrolase [Saprospiraceae bacterium]